MVSCLVAGSINIDEFYTVPHIVRPGETLSSLHYHRRGGGKGGNQAVSAARASGSVKLEAAIGKDGKDLLPFMSEVGVDVTGVDVVETSTGRAIIQLSEDGENSIVLFAGANHLRFPSSNAFDGVSHLVVQNEIPFEATLQYLATAREKNVTTLFNPSPMPSVEQLQKFPWETIDWLLLNEGEAGDIASAFDSASPEGTSSVQPGDLPAAAKTAMAILVRLRNLPKFKGINLVCTLGAAGAVVYPTSSEVIYRPAAPLLNPLRDTTGAGDCFTGYFVAGLMRGDDLVQVITECLTACSICVENPGAAESVPTRDDVMKRL